MGQFARKAVCTFLTIIADMSDSTAKLLPRLLARSLPGLPPLPPEFIMPDYDGGSIANLPGQVAAWLGAGPFGGSPLHPEWVSALDGPVTRVVMVLVDALGYQRFRTLLEEPGSAWAWLEQRGLLAPLTSVFPSTTTAALTSLSTGLPPGRHGMLGYEMWLKEFGVTANMIQLRPMAAGRETGSLAEVGLDQDNFTRSPILARHLAAHGVDVHAFLPAFIMGSGLTRMSLGLVARHPFHTPSDLWPSLRQLLEATPGARQLVWAYWPMVDTLSHQYGPAAEAVDREARSFGEMLRQAFLEPLPASARAGNCLCCWPITARSTRPRYRVLICAITLNSSICSTCCPPAKTGPLTCTAGRARWNRRGLILSSAGRTNSSSWRRRRSCAAGCWAAH